jgi:FkbM family methyltransferase
MDAKPLIRAVTPRLLRNWLRSPRKTLRYVVDNVAFACGASRQIAAYGAWSFRCHPASRSHFSIFRSDPIQARELDDFIRYSSAGMQLLDIGAHHGFFSLAALHFGGSAAHALAVEPSEKSARIVRRNFLMNGISDRAAVVLSALGTEDGWLDMLTTGPAGGDYLIVPSEPRADAIKVRQRSMASLLQATGFAPTHVKIDVEGFEEEVLRGGEDFLRTSQPVIFLELHGDLIRRRGRRPESVIDLLRSWGYQRFIFSRQEQSDADMRTAGHNCRLTCVGGGI